MKKLIVTCIAVAQLLIASPVLAQSPIPVQTPSPFRDPDLGFSQVRETLPESRFDDSSWEEIGAMILGTLNTIIAFLALFGLIVSGIMYITAGSDADKAGKARKNIIWVITGIIIYLLSLYILPVTRAIIDRNVIQEIERQRMINESVDTLNWIQAILRSPFGTGQ